jgi:thioredoxin 1
MNTLLKFSATWCNPCKTLSKTLETVNLSSLKFIEIDVDREPDIAKAHNVRSVPTLILINGETFRNDRCTGVKTKEQLLQFLGLTE